MSDDRIADDNQKLWELKQRQQILTAWHRLAMDLGTLVKDGILNKEDSVGAAIETLSRMRVEDVS